MFYLAYFTSTKERCADRKDAPPHKQKVFRGDVFNVKIYV